MSYTKIDALRRLYEKLGGSDSWDGVNLITEAIDKVTEVATGGGGSSDFSTAEVTFYNSNPSASSYYSISNYIYLDNQDGLQYADLELDVDGGASTTITFVLYNGEYLFAMDNLTNVDVSAFPTVTGNVAIDAENGVFRITGNGSVTAKSA